MIKNLIAPVVIIIIVIMPKKLTARTTRRGRTARISTAYEIIARSTKRWRTGLSGYRK
jgi:hypothetical protein